MFFKTHDNATVNTLSTKQQATATQSQLADSGSKYLQECQHSTKYNLKIQVFWHVTLHMEGAVPGTAKDCWYLHLQVRAAQQEVDYHTSENDDTKFQQEIQNHSPIDTVSHPKRPESSDKFHSLALFYLLVISWPKTCNSHDKVSEQWLDIPFYRHKSNHF